MSGRLQVDFRGWVVGCVTVQLVVLGQEPSQGLAALRGAAI